MEEQQNPDRRSFSKEANTQKRGTYRQRHQSGWVLSQINLQVTVWIGKLVSRPANPLTARVIVNRFWQHFWYRDCENSRRFWCARRTARHAELLDWLAMELIESGWNVQKLQKQILLSSTYQQSSAVSEEHLKIDPENRLLAHGPRFRLDAESIRDQALFVSGLMHVIVGGPSVKPYQPAGLWKPVGFGGSNVCL